MKWFFLFNKRLADWLNNLALRIEIKSAPLQFGIDQGGSTGDFTLLVEYKVVNGVIYVIDEYRIPARKQEWSSLPDLPKVKL